MDRPVARILAGALTIASVLTGCILGFGDCAMKPLGLSPIAALAPPGQPIVGPPASSCGSNVEFDGRTYFRSGDSESWTVAIDDLDPIGVASAANEPAWENITVYAIKDVAPEHAVAMQYGPAAEIAVLLAGEMPESLCAYTTSPEVNPVCVEGS